MKGQVICGPGCIRRVGYAARRAVFPGKEDGAPLTGTAGTQRRLPVRERMEKVRMKKGSCPYCGREVEPIRFGEGWVGICCGLILYNERQAPEEDPAEDEDMGEAFQE